MKISKDEVAVDPSELSGLSDLALKAIQVKADQTKITPSELVSGMITDWIGRVKSELVVKSGGENEDIVAALATASPQLIESIRQQLSA